MGFPPLCSVYSGSGIWLKGDEYGFLASKSPAQNVPIFKPFLLKSS